MSNGIQQKSVRSLITELHEDNQRIIFSLCRGDEVWEDLYQETCMDAIRYFDEKQWTEQEFMAMFYKLAKMKWFYSPGDAGRDVKNFLFVFKRFSQLSVSEDFLLERISEGESEETIFKELVEASTLTELERVLLNKYLEVNCKVSQMSRDLDVSIPALKDRMEVIKDKLKDAGDRIFD